MIGSPLFRGMALLAGLAGCALEARGPVALDTRNERCGFCQMAVSDARTAGQIVAPGEEPVFFDDLGCLASYLAARKMPRGAVAYVADHRTKAWVEAATAVYARLEDLDTPMASHLVAHADAASRQADLSARGGVAVAWEELLAKRGER